MYLLKTSEHDPSGKQHAPVGRSAHVSVPTQREPQSTPTYPFGETYDRWQRQRANYIVTDDDAIVGLVTLNRETLSEWPEYAGLGPVTMLRGLATHPDHSGTGVGSMAVQEVIRLAADRHVFLDCISGRLPEFYRSLGFEAIARQMLTDRDGDRYDVTLMQIQLDYP